MSYKALASAVVVAAVEDLQAAYKKVRRWDALDKNGGLRGYVERELEKQEKVKTKNYNNITLTNDDKTAVDFFRDTSRIGDLFCSIRKSLWSRGILSARTWVILRKKSWLSGSRRRKS